MFRSTTIWCLKHGEFIEAKPNEFNRRGIEHLLDCWQNVVNNEGNTLLNDSLDLLKILSIKINNKKRK